MEMPTIEKLAQLVREMREAQKEYFLFRRNSTLQKAKQLEIKVDEMLSKIPTPQEENNYSQSNLF